MTRLTRSSCTSMLGASNQCYRGPRFEAGICLHMRCNTSFHPGNVHFWRVWFQKSMRILNKDKSIYLETIIIIIILNRYQNHSYREWIHIRFLPQCWLMDGSHKHICQVALQSPQHYDRLTHDQNTHTYKDHKEYNNNH